MSSTKCTSASSSTTKRPGTSSSTTKCPGTKCTSGSGSGTASTYYLGTNCLRTSTHVLGIGRWAPNGVLSEVSFLWGSAAPSNWVDKVSTRG